MRTDKREYVFRGTIDVASINTREDKRDAHLRSADFFDVENYPEITFDGRFTERMSDLEFGAETDLTIRGTTKEVALDVEGPDRPLEIARLNPLSGRRIDASQQPDFLAAYAERLACAGHPIGDRFAALHGRLQLLLEVPAGHPTLPVT